MTGVLCPARRLAAPRRHDLPPLPSARPHGRPSSGPRPGARLPLRPLPPRLQRLYRHGPARHQAPAPGTGPDHPRLRQGVPTAQLARELGCDRSELLNLRHRFRISPSTTATSHPSLRGPAKQALEQPRHRGCPPGGKGLAGGRADGGNDAVQDAEDAGRSPPDQPPGLRRPGLLAAGRPGARLATRPTPTGTPKDPPRRRVTASLAHQNRGSGPGWRTPVRRVSQPPEAAKPLPGALGARFPPVHAPLHTKRPPPGNFPNAETPTPPERQ